MVKPISGLYPQSIPTGLKPEKNTGSAKLGETAIQQAFGQMQGTDKNKPKAAEADKPTPDLKTLLIALIQLLLEKAGSDKKSAQPAAQSSGEKSSGQAAAPPTASTPTPASVAPSSGAEPTGQTPAISSPGSVTPTNAISPTDPAMANAVLQQVNELREQNGLQPLTLDNQLNQSAQSHSEDQAKMGQMTHDGSDGSKFSDRIARTGFNMSTGAENVAKGQKTPDEVMNSWINSPGHLKNLLNPNVTKLGIGYANGYWTMNLAS